MHTIVTFFHAFLLLLIFITHVAPWKMLGMVAAANADEPKASLNIFVTTFNANAQIPPEDLRDWFVFYSGALPDLIAIGIQEIETPHLSTLNRMGTYIGNGNKEQEWLDLFEQQLSNHKLIVSTRLVGIWLAIYAHKATMPTAGITDVRTDSVSTGLAAGNIGNKGAVAVSLRLPNGVRICFVNSHLAAGSKWQKRNDEFKRIYQEMFRGVDFDVEMPEHDAIIWFGDFNYRLDTRLPRDDVIALIDSGNYQRLLNDSDQLTVNMQISANEAFDKFTEHPIQFKPTYKYDRGTKFWDSSGKERVPAWCDRILYSHKADRVELKQLAYTSAENGFAAINGGKSNFLFLLEYFFSAFE